MKNEKIVVFLDSVSRTIAGIEIGFSDTTISIENPVIVNAMPGQNGQMSLQLIPVFFREILDDKNQSCVFEYNRDQITTTNITALDNQIESQYEMLFKPIPVIVDTELTEPDEDDDKTINLFDDKEEENG